MSTDQHGSEGVEAGRAETPKHAFRRGAIVGLPFVLLAVPFGALFGVLASGAGLTLLQTMGFSAGVLAGASQFAALQLMIDGAPLAIAVLAGLLVNLRMAMYSAALAPYLGRLPFWQRGLAAYTMLDQTYVMSVMDYENRPGGQPAARFAFYMGVTLPMVVTWIAGTWVGVVMGAAIPSDVPLDFMLPVAFLALIGPALRRAAHVAAALVSVAVALALVWVPWNLGLMVAAVAAMVTGAQVELWEVRRGLVPPRPPASDGSRGGGS